jgi:hypothetical protein
MPSGFQRRLVERHVLGGNPGGYFVIAAAGETGRIDARRGRL